MVTLHTLRAEFELWNKGGLSDFHEFLTCQFEKNAIKSVEEIVNCVGKYSIKNIS